MADTKILITIPWFLPAYRAGGPIRSIANLVDNYKNAEFYIFTGDTDITGAALEGVETGKWLAWNDHTYIWYADHDKISHELTGQAARLKPDIIFITGLYSWHFSIVPLLFCRAPKKIISVRGMLHPGALAQKKWKKKIFLTIFKLLEYNHRVFFHATDEDEMQYIKLSLGEVARVYIAGNFPTRIGKQPTLEKISGSLKLATIALISPMKNILKVLDELRNVDGKVEYNIYGSIRDEDYWDECKKVIAELPANISVSYHQSVSPDQVASVLAEHHVMILPSESENFGHAIYESLSAGRPVITSLATPFNGLKAAKAGVNVDPGQVYSIRDAVQFFVGMKESEWSKWSAGAHQYGEAYFNSDRLLSEYREMFRRGESTVG